MHFLHQYTQLLGFFLQNAAVFAKRKNQKNFATLSTVLYKGTGPGVCVLCEYTLGDDIAVFFHDVSHCVLLLMTNK